MKKIIFFPVPIVMQRGGRKYRTPFVIRKMKYTQNDGVCFIVSDSIYGGEMAIPENLWPKEWLF